LAKVWLGRQLAKEKQLLNHDLKTLPLREGLYKNSNKFGGIVNGDQTLDKRIANSQIKNLRCGFGS
jgi:hypothetical protein